MRQISGVSSEQQITAAEIKQPAAFYSYGVPVSAPGPSKLEKLRALHGDDCWWCFKPINFDAEARKSQRPSIEHLQPKSKGGTNALDNLRLCHPGCNKQLADRTRTEKEALRQRRLRRQQRTSSGAAPIPGPKPALKAAPAAQVISRWRTLAMASIAVAIFLAGLSLGLMIGQAR